MSVKINTGNANVSEWIKLGSNIILIISGSSELLDINKNESLISSSYSESSSYAKQSQYALNVKNVPFHVHTPTQSTNPTGGLNLSKGGKYPITSSWSECSITSTYISGSLVLEGTNGYFPMYSGSSLTSKSSLLDEGLGVYSSKPFYATNLPSSVIQLSGSNNLTLVNNKFIPIVIDGKLYKLALVQ